MAERSVSQCHQNMRLGLRGYDYDKRRMQVPQKLGTWRIDRTICAAEWKYQADLPLFGTLSPIWLSTTWKTMPTFSSRKQQQHFPPMNLQSAVSRRGQLISVVSHQFGISKVWPCNGLKTHSRVWQLVLVGGWDFCGSCHPLLVWNPNHS